MRSSRAKISSAIGGVVCLLLITNLIAGGAPAQARVPDHFRNSSPATLNRAIVAAGAYPVSYEFYTEIAQDETQSEPQQTTVAGTIITDTIWTTAGSPYILTDHVIVMAGVTLTVTAGVEVQGTADHGLKVDGQLLAVGTPTEPITFTSQLDGGGGEWDGLSFRPGSSGQLAHAVIKCGGTWDGIAYSDVTVHGATVSMDHLQLLNSTQPSANSSGLHISGGATVAIQASDIGGHDGHGIFLQDSSLTLSDTVIHGNGEYGLYLASAGSILTLADNTIRDNAAAPLHLWPDQVGGSGLATTSFSANGRPGIEIAGDLLRVTSTWPAPEGSWYRLMGNVSVGASRTLTLGPGVLIKTLADRGLRVDGTLMAAGTVTQPVTFTSDADSAGGQWDGLTFRPGSAGTLSYAVVRYAGDWDGLAYSAVTVRGPATVAISQTQILDSNAGTAGANGLHIYGGAEVTVHDSTVGRHDGHGVYLAGSSLTLSGLTIHDNGGHGVYVGDPEAVPMLMANTIQNNGAAPIHLWPGQIPAAHLTTNSFVGNGQPGVEVEGGLLEEDAEWPALADSWYRLMDSVSVGPATTLRLAPGVVIKGVADRGLRVDGQLLAEGAPEHPLLFTSDADTAPGEWDGLTFRPGSSGRLTHAVVRYAGDWDGIAYSGISVRGSAGLVISETQMIANLNTGLYVGEDSELLVVDSTASENTGSGAALVGGTVTMTHVILSNNTTYGLHVANNSRPVILECVVQGNGDDGVHSVDAQPRIYGSTITANAGDGIFLSGNAAPEIHNSLVHGNTGCAIRNGSSLAVNAQFNWWGAAPPDPVGFCTEPGETIYGNWLHVGAVTPYRLSSLEFAADQHEPNDGFDSALQMDEPGSLVDAFISPHGDADYYQIELPQAGTFAAMVDPYGSQLAPQITIYDAGEAVLAETSGGTGTVISATAPVSPGLYYVAVRDVDGAHDVPVPYTLTPLLTAMEAGVRSVVQTGSEPLGLLPPGTTVDLPVGGTAVLQARVPSTATLSAGGYYLRATMDSASGQTLAKDLDSFYLTASSLGLSISCDQPAYKPSETVLVTGAVSNRGVAPIANQVLTLTAESTPFYTQTVDLSPGENVSFTAAVTAQVPFSLTGTISDVVVTQHILVASPVVSATLVAPEISLPGEIQAELSLINTGMVPAAFHLSFLNLDQSMALGVGEMTVLTQTTLITEDLLLTAELTGEVTQTITRPVLYSTPPVIVAIPEEQYPVGLVEVPYQALNPGLLDLTFPVTFTLTPTSGGSLNRTGWPFLGSPLEAQTVVTHALPAGGVLTSTLAYDLPKDTYTLTFLTPFQAGSAAFDVLNEVELEVEAEADSLQPSERAVVISATISNVGFNPFSGTLSLTSLSYGEERPVQLEPAATGYYSSTVDQTGLSRGVYSASLTLLMPNGESVASELVSWTLQGPEWHIAPLSIETDLTVGHYYTYTFAITNEGDVADQAAFEFELGDVARDIQFVWLEVGQTAVLTTSFYVADDLFSGKYEAVYSVSSEFDPQGDAGGLTLDVTGIDILVAAQTDRQTYLEGETATITLAITNTATASTPDLYALTSFNNITRTQAFSLPADSSTQIPFAIPVSFTGDSKLFYGVYNTATDRAIHLNTLYLYAAQPDVTLLLNKQVYSPGETVHAAIVTARTGMLSVLGPAGWSATVPLSGEPTSLDVPVPGTMAQGTYYLYYTLTDCNCDNEGREWSVPFDVAAATAHVTDVQLVGGDAVGDLVTATLTVMANQNIDGTLINWLEYPNGAAGAEAEQAITLQPIPNNYLVVTAVITDAQWGSYQMRYHLEMADPGHLHQASDQIELLKGTELFDVGRAALLSAQPDKDAYATTDDPVFVVTQIYANAPLPAQLQCALDDGTEQLENLLLTEGIQVVSVTLPSGVTPGHRLLTTTLHAEGHNSLLPAAASFDYGTSLPDLRPGVPSLASGTEDSRSISSLVTNVGDGVAASTTARFYDGNPSLGGTPIGTAPVPALGTGEQHVARAVWDITGKGGEHSLYVTVDPVGEFNEDNNQAHAVITLSRLDAGLAVEPEHLFPGESVTIKVQLKNLQGMSSLPVTATVDIRSPQGDLVFDGSWDVMLAGGEVRWVEAEWSSGLDAEAGSYSVLLTSWDGYGERDLESASFTITIPPPPPCNALTGLSTAGPMTGTIDVDYSFVATASPLTATLPLTYTWLATQQTPITNTAGLSNTVFFSWTIPGPQFITVTAANECGVTVSDTHAITITEPPPCIALSMLSLAGPPLGIVGTGYAFTATVGPPTVTLPISYTWQVSEQVPMTHTAGLSDAATFVWMVPGPKTIAVTAINACSQIDGMHTVTIEGAWIHVYLPLVLRQH